MIEQEIIVENGISKCKIENGDIKEIVSVTVQFKERTAKFEKTDGDNYRLTWSDEKNKPAH